MDKWIDFVRFKISPYTLIFNFRYFSPDINCFHRAINNANRYRHQDDITKSVHLDEGKKNEIFRATFS